MLPKPPAVNPLSMAKMDYATTRRKVHFKTRSVGFKPKSRSAGDQAVAIITLEMEEMPQWSVPGIFQTLWKNTIAAFAMLPLAEAVTAHSDRCQTEYLNQALGMSGSTANYNCRVEVLGPTIAKVTFWW